ncbi:hypothetical protein E8E15_000694 [Penicillium rubens]|nr:hypothetical protein E8E15_000694 [Penicillium rubens]KAJ5993074.1 hypothetical protein N7451_008798 [Penicillium sp. IBT 35674x]KAJ5993402.1 hypothetical protein N7451_009126 [Penicillium sp. IBT 35674x]
MANSNGYVVLKQAVSASLASKLADDFQNGIPEPTATKDKYNEYKVPQRGFEIKDEFLRNMDKDAVAQLFSPNQIPSSLQTVNLGMFHETDADPTKLMTAGPRVYITIAITTLSPSNGWFTFYEGSHRQRSRLGKKAALNLEPGDAVAWRGDLVYFHSPGGGGIFLVLSFPMGSDD